jgi:hypothetical protein
MVKTAHQIPLAPMATRREKVEPFMSVTGMSVRRRRRIPAVYPEAIPRDESRAVARERTRSYSSLALG